MELHWLPVRGGLILKFFLLLVKVIKGLPPKYLSVLIAFPPFSSYDLRRDNNGILLARSTLIYPSDVHANSYPHRVQGGGG